MDSFEFNKIAGAVLGSALFVLAVSTLSDALFASHPPEEPVYLAGLTISDDGAESGAEEEESAVALLASADAGKGENVAKKCAACHTFESGGADKQGPNLWGVVNRTIGSKDGFSYSPDLAGLGAGGEVWDYESLDTFLRKPKDFASGTKMAFGGISRVSDRADLMAYLRSLSDSPAPLPETSEQAAAGSDAAADTPDAGAAPAGDAGAADAEPGTAGSSEEPAESEAATEPDAQSTPESDAPTGTDQQ